MYIYILFKQEEADNLIGTYLLTIRPDALAILRETYQAESRELCFDDESIELNWEMSLQEAYRSLCRIRVTILLYR